jgi:hypothetical protein
MNDNWQPLAPQLCDCAALRAGDADRLAAQTKKVTPSGATTVFVNSLPTTLLHPSTERGSHFAVLKDKMTVRGHHKCSHGQTMMFHSLTVQRTIVKCSAFAFMVAVLGEHAHAGGNLEASYTISFARIRVGDITATVVMGDSEYAISARGRAGGIIKLLIDGEGSFTARGSIKDDHLVPTTFTSKIVSSAETSDVTMVLDEGNVKELEAAPLPSRELVPVTEANRQGIIDPLTAMLFSTAPTAEGLSRDACRRTLPIFDGRHRYDLKLAFKHTDQVSADKGYAGQVVVCSVRYEPIAGHRASTPLIKYLSEGREMEVALAPIAGTRMLLPFRVSVVSMLANLVIEANRFEATSQPPGASTVADPKAQ